MFSQLQFVVLSARRENLGETDAGKALDRDAMPKLQPTVSIFGLELVRLRPAAE